LPLGIEREVVTLKVEVPEPAIELGEKAVVPPLGNPLTLRFTLSLNPPVPVMVTLKEVLLPALMLLDPGETAIEKLGLAGA